MTTFYGTSALKRQRRSNAELDQIDAAIHEIAEAERPVSVRGLFYRVMSRGLVPKSEIGYKVVQRQALKMRRAGDLPYSWITDGSRLRLQPNTWDSASQALEVTAELYRRALWFDQGGSITLTDRDTDGITAARARTLGALLLQAAEELDRG